MARTYRQGARAEAAEATRRAIAAAAWRRFAREPFDLVRLADIAGDAGVTARTVFNQFESKEALFVAAFTQMAEDAGAARAEATPRDPRAAARMVCETYEARGDALLLLEDQEQRIPAVRAMTERSRERHREEVRALAAPLLARLPGAAGERRLAQLVAATDVRFWHRMRHREGLSSEQTELAMAEMLTALLELDTA